MANGIFQLAKILKQPAAEQGATVYQYGGQLVIGNRVFQLLANAIPAKPGMPAHFEGVAKEVGIACSRGGRQATQHDLAELARAQGQGQLLQVLDDVPFDDSDKL